MVSPARRAALDALRLIHTGDRDLASVMEEARHRLQDSRDRALAAELVFGTLRWRGALDFAVAWIGHRDVSEFDAIVLDVLRIGAYQILYLTRVPAAAAVNDAVELCRLAGARPAAGAVNAILRSLARRRGSIPWPAETDGLAFFSATLSHPGWLAARWQQRLGVTRAAAWARFNNEPPAPVVRAHAWRESREDLAGHLASLGVTTEPTRFAPDGLVVTGGGPVSAAMGLGTRFSIQDESSQLVAAFVGARPGQRILDACAAPGGKTGALACATGGQGLIVAGDLRPRRVRLLQRLVSAAGVPGVAFVRADAERAVPFGAIFDAVLVDAPCSGLGTIRRDPDIRWRRQEADLPAFAARQIRMLVEASASVHPSGRLVYATCSSEPDENEHVVQAFLDASPGWSREPPARRVPALPAGVLACVDADGCLRTSPDRHGLEPFFAACLRRF